MRSSSMYDSYILSSLRYILEKSLRTALGPWRVVKSTGKLFKDSLRILRGITRLTRNLQISTQTIHDGIPTFSICDIASESIIFWYDRCCRIRQCQNFLLLGLFVFVFCFIWSHRSLQCDGVDLRMMSKRLKSSWCSESWNSKVSQKGGAVLKRIMVQITDKQA